MTLHAVDHRTGLLDRAAQLLLGDAELARPVLKLVRLVDVDARAVARTAIVGVVGHRSLLANGNASSLDAPPPIVCRRGPDCPMRPAPTRSPTFSRRLGDLA